MYIILTCISCLSIFDGMSTSLKLCHVFIIGIGFLYFIFLFDKKDMIIYKDFLIRYSLFLLILFILSNLIWVINLTDVTNIIRGYEKFAYQLITILAVISACYMFKERAIDLTFFGFVLFNILSIVFAIQKVGIQTAINDFIYFLKTFGAATGFMKYLELHDVTFCFGMFALYYFLVKESNRIPKMLIALFFFGIGYKRIGALAFIVCIVIATILKRKSFEMIKNVSVVAGILIMLLGFIYIIITHADIFNQLMSFFNINTMGRNELAEFIKDYYDIDILYPGRGFEFITVLFQSAKYGTLNMAKIGALHNGYLTVYIEFGFIGFFLWESFWLIWQMIWIRKYSREVLLTYMILTIYLFITYLTDNTAFYFYTCIVYRLIPMAQVFKNSEVKHV